MRVLGAAIVAAAAIAVVFGWVLKHPAYTPDGSVYARFAARDAGYSDTAATRVEEAFYGKTPLAANPRYREIIDLPPNVWFARSHVFVNRVLYPWVAGMAIGVAGLRALFLVNAAAYVAFGIALFWMLMAFKRWWIALPLAFVALALPAVRGAAASDLSDMLGILWWTIALGALLRSTRGTSPALLVTLCAASILLALTRPTPYLLVLPALALGVVSAVWTPLLASLGGVAVYAAVAASTHAYGLSGQLHWIYEHRPAGSAAVSFNGWYRSAALSSLRYVAAESVRSVVPLVMLAVALYGLLRRSTQARMTVLVGAAAACLVSVPFNPVPSSFGRVVLLPLVPVFCAMVQCAAEAMLEPKAAQAPVEPAPEAVVSG